MKKLITLFAILFFSVSAHSQNARVIGYFPQYRFEVSNQIEYSKLTHLNLTFANPDEEGNLIMEAIDSVVADALAGNPNIVIMISLAGGLLTDEEANNWSNLIDVPENRPAFITKIVQYVLDNNLDGVDIDLEWDHVTTGYSGFVLELKAALDAEGKIITAALPNETRFKNITQDALNAFDWINIMSYDATGPWENSPVGQHSSLENSEKGISFWKNEGVLASNLNLGIPFYGYDFSFSPTKAFTFAQKVEEDASYAEMDNVGSAYYNGRPTIEAKIDLANKEVGGVLIWEIGQDAFNEYSLLTTIHNKYTSLGTYTTGLKGNEVTLSTNDFQNEKELEIFPNPTAGTLVVSNLKKEETYSIYDVLGKPIFKGSIHPNQNRIDVRHLDRAVYFLQFGGKSMKFVKVDAI